MLAMEGPLEGHGFRQVYITKKKELQVFILLEDSTSQSELACIFF